MFRFPAFAAPLPAPCPLVLGGACPTCEPPFCVPAPVPGFFASDVLAFVVVSSTFGLFRPCWFAFPIEGPRRVSRSNACVLRGPFRATFVRIAHLFLVRSLSALGGHFFEGICVVVVVFFFFFMRFVVFLRQPFRAMRRVSFVPALVFSSFASTSVPSFSFFSIFFFTYDRSAGAWLD